MASSVTWSNSNMQSPKHSNIWKKYKKPVTLSHSTFAIKTISISAELFLHARFVENKNGSKVSQGTQTVSIINAGSSIDYDNIFQHCTHFVKAGLHFKSFVRQPKRTENLIGCFKLWRQTQNRLKKLPTWNAALMSRIHNLFTTSFWHSRIFLYQLIYVITRWVIFSYLARPQRVQLIVNCIL